jgi:hypothetical protein
LTVPVAMLCDSLLMHSVGPEYRSLSVTARQSAIMHG